MTCAVLQLADVGRGILERGLALQIAEPGVLAYICHRSAKKPDELVFFEVYKDEEALKAHGKTPHMAKMAAAFATLFRPPVEVTRLDRVGGFTR